MSRSVREMKGGEKDSGLTLPVKDAPRPSTDVLTVLDLQLDLLDLPPASLVVVGGGWCCCSSRDGETLPCPAGLVHACAEAVSREEAEQARQLDGESTSRHGLVRVGGSESGGRREVSSRWVRSSRCSRSPLEAVLEQPTLLDPPLLDDQRLTGLPAGRRHLNPPPPSPPPSAASS